MVVVGDWRCVLINAKFFLGGDMSYNDVIDLIDDEILDDNGEGWYPVFSSVRIDFYGIYQIYFWVNDA